MSNVLELAGTAELISPKKPRNEIRLPELYYIACDDWISKDKLDEKTFCTWLKLLTMVDRTGKQKKDGTVPNSIEKIAKRLEISRSTLERRLKKLWDYWLIDLEEWDNGKKAQNPINIIVYEYPKNERNRAVQPLEKLRDYENDYVSYSKILGKEGAEIKKLSTNDIVPVKNEREEEKPHNEYPVKNEREENAVGVPVKNERESLSKMKANNVLNIFYNVLKKKYKNINNIELQNFEEMFESLDEHIQDVFIDHAKDIELLDFDVMAAVKFCYANRKRITPRNMRIGLIRTLQYSEPIIDMFKFMNMACGQQMVDQYIEQQNEQIRSRMEQEPKPEPKETAYTGKVKFYNWLEE